MLTCVVPEVFLLFGSFHLICKVVPFKLSGRPEKGSEFFTMVNNEQSFYLKLQFKDALWLWAAHKVEKTHTQHHLQLDIKFDLVSSLAWRRRICGRILGWCVMDCTLGWLVVCLLAFLVTSFEPGLHLALGYLSGDCVNWTPVWIELQCTGAWSDHWEKHSKFFRN